MKYNLILSIVILFNGFTLKSQNNGVYVDRNGNVGIGTQKPKTKFHVLDTTGASNFYINGDPGGYPRIYLGGYHTGIAGVINRITPGSTLYFGESGDAGGYLFRGSGNMSIQGNVGIGIISPQAKLNLPHGGVGTNQILIGAFSDLGGNDFEHSIAIPATASHWPFGIVKGGSKLFTVDNNGNVGVGSSAPLGVLDVVGSGVSASNWVYLRGNTGTGSGNPSSSVASGLMYGWNPSGGLGESQILYSTSAGSGPRLDFGRWNGTNKTIDMTLNGGNVGIGTTSPGALLDIAGGTITVGNNALNVGGTGTSSGQQGTAITVSSNNGDGGAILAISNSLWPAIQANNNSSSPNYATGIMANVNSSNEWGFFTNGGIYSSAGSSVFTSFKGSKGTTILSSPVSTKVEIQFSGQGKLSGGKQEVVFDGYMSELISENPYKILLTPTAECNGLIVLKKTDNGFTVQELGKGTSNATFDWFLIADKAVSAIDQSAHPMPKNEPKIMESVQKIPSKK